MTFWNNSAWNPTGLIKTRSGRLCSGSSSLLGIRYNSSETRAIMTWNSMKNLPLFLIVQTRHLFLLQALSLWYLVSNKDQALHSLRFCDVFKDSQWKHLSFKSVSFPFKHILKLSNQLITWVLHNFAFHSSSVTF